MRQRPPPLRSLVLQDLCGDTTLTIAHSNQGDPYRETISLSFERGAHGSYKNYEHLGSVELEPHEEEKLRDLLNARHERHRQGQGCT